MKGRYVTVNIEEGMPFCDEAIKRLDFHIKHERACGAVCIKVIHGFGSTGAGGKIRVRARSHLEALKKSGKIIDFIPGEKLSIFDASTRGALDICPDLRQDRDMERHNNGVTVIRL